jgi:hypothetical protein
VLTYICVICALLLFILNLLPWNLDLFEKVRVCGLSVVCVAASDKTIRNTDFFIYMVIADLVSSKIGACS